MNLSCKNANHTEIKDMKYMKEHSQIYLIPKFIILSHTNLSQFLYPEHKNKSNPDQFPNVIINKIGITPLSILNFFQEI